MTAARPADAPTGRFRLGNRHSMRARRPRKPCTGPAEIRLRAERKAGQELGDMDRVKGRGGDRKSSCSVQLDTLAKLGVEKTAAHRWQTLERIPEKLFEEYIAACLAERLNRYPGERFNETLVRHEGLI
jgi:hypothetical protein